MDGKLSDVIGDLKKHTAKSIACKMQEDGKQLWLTVMERAAGAEGGIKVWDDGFHPEQVYSQQFFQQKMDYLHNNPIRAGFVTNLADWQYSSAGFYYREEKPVVPITLVEL